VAAGTQEHGTGRSLATADATVGVPGFLFSLMKFKKQGQQSQAKSECMRVATYICSWAAVAMVAKAAATMLARKVQAGVRGFTLQALLAPPHRLRQQQVGLCLCVLMWHSLYGLINECLDGS
jgi:hypothetical protein